MIRFPEKGFWQHYKHDPEKDVFNYRYEVLGISFHTETEGYLVRYRPLYDERSYLGEADQSARPLELWFTDVEWQGKTVPRFTRITDSELTKQLETRRKELYGI